MALGLSQFCLVSWLQLSKKMALKWGSCPFSTLGKEAQGLLSLFCSHQCHSAAWWGPACVLYWVFLSIETSDTSVCTVKGLSKLWTQ